MSLSIGDAVQHYQGGLYTIVALPGACKDFPTCYRGETAWGCTGLFPESEVKRVEEESEEDQEEIPAQQPDWSKAPEWAGALVSDARGGLYWVEQWGGISKRQELGRNAPDTDNVADMYEPHAWKLICKRPATPQGRDPEDGLPTIGAKGCTSGGKCEVLGVDDIKRQIFIRWYDGETGVVPVHVFRPIDQRTDREKWIEAAERAMELQTSWPASSTQLGYLYDAGLAKLPE